jgi:poly(A) polymerase Pap1
LKYAHPFPGSFPHHDAEHEQYCSSFFLGLTISISKEPNASKTIDLTPPAAEFATIVKEWNGRTPTMEIHIKYIKRYVGLQQCPPQCAVVSCLSFPSCSNELPDYVFPNGERPKPVVSAKRKRTAAGAAKQQTTPQDDKRPKTEPNASPTTPQKGK